MGNSSSSEQCDVAVARPVSYSSHRHRQFERIEKFVSAVYSSCPRVDAMWLILTSKLGQKAFLNFVRGDQMETVLSVFIVVSDVISNVKLSAEWDESLAQFEKVQEKLSGEGADVCQLMPELLRNEFLLDFRTDPDIVRESKTIVQLLDRLQSELVLTLTRECFQRFLQSKFYKNWRASESSHAVATTFEDASISNLTDLSAQASARSSTRSGFLIPQSSKFRFRQRTVVQPADLSLSAFAQMEGETLQHILQSRESWLAALIAAVEALPVAFSLSAAEMETTFPVIYVNKCCEKVLGKAREEFLNRPLLDVIAVDSDSDSASVPSLSLDALRRLPSEGGAGCTRLITTKPRRAKHVAGLKAVMDDQGRFLYVLGLHFDCSRDLDFGAQKVTVCAELLETLPYEILSTTEEEAAQEGDLDESVRSQVKHKSKDGDTEKLEPPAATQDRTETCLIS